MVKELRPYKDWHQILVLTVADYENKCLANESKGVSYVVPTNEINQILVLTVADYENKRLANESKGVSYVVPTNEINQELKISQLQVMRINF
jgi:hypothetical protein